MSYIYYAFAPAPRPIESLHQYGDRIYKPIHLLYEHTFLREPLGWYLDDWAEYGYKSGLELDQSVVDDYEEMSNANLSDQSEPLP